MLQVASAPRGPPPLRLTEARDLRRTPSAAAAAAAQAARRPARRLERAQLAQHPSWRGVAVGESTAAPSRRAARAARACPRAAERRRAARSRGTTAGRLGRTRDALRGRRRHLQALERTSQRKGTEARATEGFTCAQRYEEHASAFAQRYKWRVRHSPRAKQRAPSDAKDLGRHERSRRGNGRPSDSASRAQHALLESAARDHGGGDWHVYFGARAARRAGAAIRDLGHPRDHVGSRRARGRVAAYSLGTYPP